MNLLSNTAKIKYSHTVSVHYNSFKFTLLQCKGQILIIYLPWLYATSYQQQTTGL